MENMSFSTNIDSLIHIKNVTMNEVIYDTKKKLITAKENKTKINNILKPSFVIQDELQEDSFEIPSQNTNLQNSQTFRFGESVNYPSSDKSLNSPPIPRFGMNIDSELSNVSTDSIPYANVSPAYSPNNGGFNRILKENTSNILSLNENQNKNIIDQTAGKKISNSLKNEINYQIGEHVLLRGINDGHPNRIWKIKKIGDMFYTVETDDMRGMQSNRDSIQVVSPMDICSLNEVKYANQFTVQDPNLSPFLQNPSTQINRHFDNIGSSTPNINVNPVIKIVNGPDNSVETSPPQNTISPGENFNQSYDNNSIPTIVNSSNDNFIKIPVPNPSLPEEATQNVFNEGAPIIIKKLSS
jgi:hypothetical protein